MVFFICSHCGASLKKSKVEKHYTVQCHNAPQVSCMDCHKEFRGNDYVAHTKCITEDEKYSAKGFVPKPSSNKGECKQQEWLDIVRGVQSQANLPKCLKIVLDGIVKFENIPRKKPKFMNFLKSNHIRLLPRDLDQLWDLLEKEHKRMKENLETSATNKVAEMKSEDSAANVDKDSDKQNGDVSVEIVQECETTPKDKTKKKKKKSKGEVSDVGEKESGESLQAVEKQNETSMNVDQDCEDTPKSKTKKKKKDKTEMVDESQENENLKAADELDGKTSTEITKECEVTPKEKTKKKKNKKENISEVTNDTERQENENFQVPEESTPVESNIESRTTAKRKTKEDKTEVGSEVVDDSDKQVPEEKQEDVPLTKKQKKEKKKREKYEAELKEIENSQFNDLPPEEDDDEQNRKKKKSRKDKDLNGLDINVNGVTGVQTEEMSIKPKKKRHLDDDQPVEPSKKKKKEPQDDEQVEEMCTTECVTAENTNGMQKFQWNEAILEVVRSKGGEIPIKRLRKKVVAEYQNCCSSAESEDKLIVKFSKKLLKVPGIIVHKEVVKLAE